MFAISWWAACDTIQFFFDAVPIKMFLAQLSYLGIITAPIAWVSFIFTYSQIQLKIPKWFKYFVFSFCGLFLIIVLTNSYHLMMYKRWSIEAGDFGLSFEYGPFFWAWVLVSYFCLSAGTIRLIMTAIRSVTLLRVNMILIILGALFPWIGNILYISGLNPIRGFDPTPVGFTITGVIGMIIIFRKKLFNYVPLAYQNLFINLNDPALVIDYKGEIIESNNRSRKMAGRKDLKHQSYWDFCYAIKDIPEPEILQYLDFEGNEGPEIEVSLKQAGSLSWYMMKGSRIGTSEDEKRGFLLSFREITLWKKQKNTLEKSAGLMGLSGRFAEEMLRRTDWTSVYLEYAPNFKTVARANGCFISPKPGFEKHFEGAINRESMVWHRTFTNQLKESAIHELVSDYLEVGRDAFIILPIEVNNEQVGSWVFFWSVDDKDEAAEAHDVLKLASNVLSSSIENHITEEDLRLAKETAEQASRAKSEFLSIMSHEIRTPLNAVIGISHLLRDENHDNSLDEKVNTLNNSAENLLVLVNDILDYSKIEAGKLELIEQNFNPNSLVKSLVAENQYRAIENEDKLIFNSEIPDGQIYFGDKMRIGQVLNNLISNALKFTHKGTVRVNITRLEQKGNREKIRFSIEDTGIGISSDFLPQLFDMFTQATSTSTRKFGGTGLGLAICQSLLKLMQSKLEVESIINEGSTFSFNLELENKGMTMDETINQPKIQEQSLTNMHVLIVEDNMVNVFVCQNFLKKWGVISDVAENGELGVEKVKANQYDCVLMDIQMPVMDGYEATRKIREFNTDVPIIALTASALLEKKEKTLMVGMNDFVSKPFRPDELFQVLMKYKTLADE